MNAVDRAVMHRSMDAAAAVVSALTAHIGAHPWGLDGETQFCTFDFDDADVNDIAERAAKQLGVNIVMPVRCETLGDLTNALIRALEAQRP